MAQVRRSNSTGIFKCAEQHKEKQRGKAIFHVQILGDTFREVLQKYRVFCFALPLFGSSDATYFCPLRYLNHTTPLNFQF